MDKAASQLRARDDAGPASRPAPKRPARSLRAASSAILIVVAALLAPISVASSWAGSVVSQTDRYVETVAPIAADPDVQAAVAQEVTAAIMESLDIENVTTQALEALARQDPMPARAADALPPLAVPLTRGVASFIHAQTLDLVAGPQFETVWAQANRSAHARVVSLLEGEQGGAITAQDNQVTLDLAPVIEAVAARLVDQGFRPAARLPAVERSFVLAESEAIGRAQGRYAVLTALGRWLPIVAGALLVTGILVARDRRRALLRGALGIAGATAALGLGLTLATTLLLDTSDVGTLTVRAADNVIEILLRFLRTGLRVMALTALLVALAAFVAGPSSAAVRLRSAVGRGIRAARGATDGTGRLDALTRWVRRHVGRLWVATGVGGGLAVLFMDRPTAADLLLITLAVLAVLVGITVLRRRPAAIDRRDHLETGSAARHGHPRGLAPEARRRRHAGHAGVG